MKHSPISLSCHSSNIKCVAPERIVLSKNADILNLKINMIYNFYFFEMN